eukprot:359848-Chlamydomonas_euryale.AAC.3
MMILRKHIFTQTPDLTLIIPRRWRAAFFSLRRAAHPLGKEAGALPGDPGPVAQVPGQVALPGADLRRRGDHEADPARGLSVPRDGRHVAPHHGGRVGAAGDDGRRRVRGPAGGPGCLQHVAGRRRKGPQRLPRYQEDGVPTVWPRGGRATVCVCV